MTKEECRRYIRSLLAEPQASYWDDSELDVYIEVAITNIVNEMWHMLAPVYNKTDYLDVAVGNQYIDLPADCLKVLSIRIAGNKTKAFDYIPFGLDHIYENYEFSGWKLENNKIKLIPLPTESVEDYLEIKYLPVFTFDNIPEVMKPLVAIEAVIQAKVKDELVPQHLLLLKENFKRNLLTFLSAHQTQNVEVIPE